MDWLFILLSCLCLSGIALCFVHLYIESKYEEKYRKKKGESELDFSNVHHIENDCLSYKITEALLIVIGVVFILIIISMVFYGLFLLFTKMGSFEGFEGIFNNLDWLFMAFCIFGLLFFFSCMLSESLSWLVGRFMLAAIFEMNCYGVYLILKDTVLIVKDVAINIF